MNPEPSPDPIASGGGIPAGIFGVVGAGIGLLGGYLIWGLRPASAPVATNTAPAMYAPDTVGAPVRLGSLAVRNLKSLEEWDALDPFEGGFPLPPEDWTAPLLALNPPIPVVTGLATSEGGTPAGPTGSPFAGTPAPPIIRGDLPDLPPMAPPSLGGGTEVLPANPNAPVDGAETPPQSAGAVLIVGTLTGVNEKAAAATIAALGVKYGGASRTFTHMGQEGEVEAEGVLLLVPPSEATKALSDIRKLGPLSAEDRSEGSVKARQGRLSAPFASRLATLRKRREELLVQFLEDADPIKQIDAAIDREARALAAVRLSGAADRLTAIRVLLRP